MKYFFLSILTLCVTAIYFSTILMPSSPTLPSMRARLQGPLDVEITTQPPDWSMAQREIEVSVLRAHKAAKAHTQHLLEQWHNHKMHRIETRFLDWYFDYLQQFGMGMRAVGYSLQEWWSNGETSAEEKVVHELLTELEKRVLPRDAVQRELEDIAKESVRVFLESLSKDIASIPEKYRIPRADWDEYLTGITLEIKDIEGLHAHSFSLKALTVGMFAGVGVIALPLQKVLLPMVRKTVQRSLTALSGRAARAVGQRVASSAAAGLGTSAVVRTGFMSAVGGPLAMITLGSLIAWEVMDHKATVEAQKPIMREELEGALLRMESRFQDPDGPLGAPLLQIEHALFSGLSEM